MNNQTKTNILAIVGFILSFFLGIIGSIICIVALSKIKKTGEKGKGFAIAGIVIGIVSFVVIVALGLIFTLFVWPDVQANLMGQTACANVDYMGEYESAGIDSNEEGYTKCEDFVCKVFFNDEEYEFNCLETVGE